MPLSSTQAEVALRSEGFTEVDHNTLKSVLARETLNCKEVVVFEAALSWAREECRRRGDDQPTPEKMREVRRQRQETNTLVPCHKSVADVEAKLLAT